MQVVLHCGVYSTDIAPLLGSLQANLKQKLPLKTQICDPEHTRVILRKLLRQSDVSKVNEETHDLILEAAKVDLDTQRMIVSNPAILGTYKDFTHDSMLFPNVTNYLSILQAIFKEDELEISFAMKNPATLLSSVLQAMRQNDIGLLLGTSDPLKLCWSELITRIRNHMPNIPITVWYNEDTPLVWRSVLQEILQIPHDAQIADVYRPVASLLNSDDFKRFLAYVQKHPGMTLSQERRVIATFIDKFAQSEVLEEAVDIEGWDQAFVNEMSRVYEEDQKRIAGMNDITLIVP